MARATAQAVGWDSGPLEVALAGGFLLSAAAVRESLLEGLRTEGYEPIATAVPEPAVGALILARRILSDR